MGKEKIILAYSGGLDTSIAIKWLQKDCNYDVISVCADLGEGKDLNFIKEKALKIGALKCHNIDLKEIFANEYIMPVLKANAMYEGAYPLISALSRPLIAKILVKIAHEEGAKAIAHGCTGKGNDQIRFDVAINTLDQSLKIVAPVRENPMAREEAIEYARQNNISVPVTVDNPFSIDLNLWGRSCECGILEDPWVAPPEEAYEWTTPISETTDEPEIIEIAFQAGIPISMNNKKMSLLKLIEALNKKAGNHGIGRIDHIENRLIGIKSREIYEAPAAITLIAAHKAIESLCLTRDVANFKCILEQKYANLIYEGLWYSPLKNAIDVFINEIQKNVTGIVRIKLYKGQSAVIGTKSPRSLYKVNLSTYTLKDDFDHNAAAGFIKIWGLPLEVYSMVNPEIKG